MGAAKENCALPKIKCLCPDRAGAFFRVGVPDGGVTTQCGFQLTSSAALKFASKLGLLRVDLAADFLVLCAHCEDAVLNYVVEFYAHKFCAGFDNFAVTTSCKIKGFEFLGN